MKISIRTISNRKTTIWQQVENKDTQNCDTCGKRLWEAPHGGIYCDNTHTEDQIKGG